MKKKVIKHTEQTYHKKMLGIIGYPLSHTLSPLMHNTAISYYGLDYIYNPFQVTPQNLSYALKGIKVLGFTGVNVTIPFKEAVIPYLDYISEEAKLIGAVNTIHLEDGLLKGYNTDGYGFINSMQIYSKTSPAGKTALVLGAGGAALAVVTSLSLNHIKKIFIANRTPQRADTLKSHIIKNIPHADIELVEYKKDTIERLTDKTDIIINTTSQGMSGKDDIVDFPYHKLNKHHLLCDLVYNPLETYFLKKGLEHGAAILDGIGMLLLQGSLSFEIWTKKKFPVEIIEPILRDRLLKKIC